MNQAEDVKFSCPSCGKEFKWKPEIAGKKAKCKCGGVITVPSAPPAPAAPEADPFADGNFPYDLAESSRGAPPPVPTRGGGGPPPPPMNELEGCPNCGGNIPPGAVVCMACGFNVATGRKAKPAAAASGGAKGVQGLNYAAKNGEPFNFAATWKGWLWVGLGICLMGLGMYDYARLTAMERDPENESVYLNRRTRRIYAVFGKWGVIAVDEFIGIGAVLAGLHDVFIKKGKE